MAKIVTPNSEAGQRIYEYLKRELGLPECCTWFRLDFRMNEPVRVQCAYNVTEQDERAKK